MDIEVIQDYEFVLQFESIHAFQMTTQFENVYKKVEKT